MEEQIIEEKIVYENGQKYRSETKIVPFGDGTILFTNLYPILSPEERARRRRDIEARLYKVFSKYRKPTDS